MAAEDRRYAAMLCAAVRLAAQSWANRQTAQSGGGAKKRAGGRTGGLVRLLRWDPRRWSSWPAKLLVGGGARIAHENGGEDEGVDECVPRCSYSTRAEGHAQEPQRKLTGLKGQSAGASATPQAGAGKRAEQDHAPSSAQRSKSTAQQPDNGSNPSVLIFFVCLATPGCLLVFRGLGGWGSRSNANRGRATIARQLRRTALSGAPFVFVFSLALCLLSAIQ